jgi:hypothetical protein
MRRLPLPPALLAVLLSLFGARLAAARPAQAEPSSYGRFDVIYTHSACALSFTFTGGKARVLFTVPDCSTNDLARLNAEESAGRAGLPSTSDSGEELHVFSIPAARGGNAVAGNDYWVVVVRRKTVWSSKAPFQSDGLDSLTASSTRRAVFTLQKDATTVSEGLRWVVSFGGVKKSRIPRVPSTLVSQAKRTYVGELNGGYHVTGWRPSLRVGEDFLVIHEDGKCKLPKLGEEVGRVELNAEVTRWSDGREVVRCLAVRK